MFYGLYEEFYRICRSKKLIIFGAILVALIIFMIVYHSIKLKIYRQEILDLQTRSMELKHYHYNID